MISNVAGRTSIDYRIGDYASFRHALLRSRIGETALVDWHASAQGDLALQLLEWWAYVADVLTFYNERAMHEALLGTAVLPEDVRRIIRLLGYRPRPGIGATGVVAALTDSPRPLVLGHGFPIQATAGPGKSPQVFELDQDVEVGLLGRPLPASARLPDIPGGASTWSSELLGTWSGYAARDAEGRIRNSVPAEAPRDRSLPIKAGMQTTVALSGVVTLVKPDDTVLLLKRDWKGPPADATLAAPGPFEHAIAGVSNVEHAWDEFGRAVTLVTLTAGGDLETGAQRADYRILKATKLAHLWLYHERYPGPKLPSIGGMVAQALETVFDPGGLFSGGASKEPPQDAHVLTSTVLGSLPGTGGVAHLEAITRGISPGDPVLIEQRVFPGGLPSLFSELLGGVIGDALGKLQSSTFVAKVTDYSELIWYANPPELDRIGQGPPIGPPSHGLISGGAAPIPIPHSRIAFNDPLGAASRMSMEDIGIGTVVVHYGWQDIGNLADVPPAVRPNAAAETTTPEVSRPPYVPPDMPLPVLIEDATGAGVPGWVGVKNPEGPSLVPPLRALLNLLPISRGQTVSSESLGNGDSNVLNQEFVLAHWPLTYLGDSGPHSNNGYRSTLRIRVNGIEWHEVASFYGQPADARIFVTRENEEQKTTVRFGDGQFGARLPAGTGNVVATYRYGSGAEVPKIGSLTTILRPQAGLQAIRNPIAPGGGADPDPPEQIRRYAPRSVLTFGRAVSGDDYETIAAQTPGVRRASARWVWDAASQRTLVKVFVGDDAAAVTAARTALSAFGDPNRPVMVELAAPRYVDLYLTLELDADFLPDAVSAAVQGSLLDPQRQPFGADVVRISEPVYNSQIYDVCMSVPGVVAVHDLSFRVDVDTLAREVTVQPPPGFSLASRIWDPASMDRLRPLRSRVGLKSEKSERHFPGEGRFYLLRADQLHIAADSGSARHGH